MSLTVQQQNAIGSRGRVIVSASAGSGKTHVMIERFLSILRSGEASVKEILAVTFTSKAAAQMRDRARKKLTEAYRTSSGEERARLKRQLEDLPLADISTIHSFCGRLVRTYFYLVGADPRFRIVDGDLSEARALSARALELAFDEAYEGGEEWFSDLLAVYFRKKKDATLRKTVLRIYKKLRNVDGYREKLLACSERTLPAWDISDMGAPSSFFEGEKDPAKEELWKALSLIAEDRKGYAAQLSDKAVLLKEHVEKHAPRLKGFLDTVIERAEKLSASEDLFSFYANAKESVPRSPSRNKSDPPETLRVFDETQALAKQLRELCKEYLAEPDWRAEFAHFADSYMRAASLAKLTLMYDEEYSRLKREEGVLDYGDLEHLALAVLHNEEAARAVRGSYRFIFVDEYQDVNPMQGEILKVLTGEELFVVGDKKQAIYGFRGSRTAYFTKMEEACGGALPLDRNFRSAKGILDAVNTVFTAALEGYVPMEGGDRYGEHAGEVLVHTAEKQRVEGGERGIYSVASAKEDETPNAVARKVRAIIEEECGLRGKPAKRWFDVETGTERETGFSDIAILVRKNTATAGAIVRELSSHGIPVTSAAGVNICDFFEVRLLLDWLSFLDNGEQDIPLASAMLSAIGGFCESELARIRLMAMNMHLYGCNFRTAAKKVSSDKRYSGDPLAKKVSAFFERAERLRMLSRQKSASEMLTILLADGIEAQIAGMGGGNAAMARVRRLISESAGAGSIHTFLRRIEDADNTIEFTESGGEGAVRMLTMHNAKGLEFPVVITVDLDSTFHAIDYDELMWTEELGIAPRSFDLAAKVRFETLTRRAAYIRMRQEQIEGERNLLYVAMTRAMYRLHLIFESETEGDGMENLRYFPDRARKMSEFIPREKLLSLLAPPLEEGESGEGKGEKILEADPADREKICAALSPYPHMGATLLPVKSSATSLIRDVQEAEERKGYHVRDDEEKENLIADMGEAFSTETGLAYHAFLEHVRFGADAGEELARMRSDNVLPQETLALLREEHLKAILAIPRLAALEGKRVWRERQFLVSLPADAFYKEGAGEEVIFQGAIDLLVEEGEGSYTVVDYKFSSRSAEGIRTHYAPQIALYRKAVAKTMHIPEERVGAVIINIASGEEIPM